MFGPHMVDNHIFPAEWLGIRAPPTSRPRDVAGAQLEWLGVLHFPALAHLYEPRQRVVGGSNPSQTFCCNTRTAIALSVAAIAVLVILPL